MASGVPNRNGLSHASEICGMALEFAAALRFLTLGDGLEMRSGLNSGSCAAGIVGYKTPRFCL